jgi:hypothetical protein
MVIVNVSLYLRCALAYYFGNYNFLVVVTQVQIFSASNIRRELQDSMRDYI